MKYEFSSKMSNYYCRLCLANCKPENSSLFSKDITQMIEYCMPEIDINLVNNPILCGSCHISLKQFEEFKKKCLAGQNNIKRLRFNKSIDTGDSSLTQSINKSVTIPENSKDISNESYCTHIEMIISEEKKDENADISRIENKPDVLGEVNCYDEFLSLLHSSVNIKQENEGETLLESGNRYLNFYDDESDADESSHIEISEEVPPSRINNNRTSNMHRPSKGKQSPIDCPSNVKVEKNLCISCQTKLPNFPKLLNHLYTIHHKTDALYGCLLCRHKTNTFSLIKKHYDTVHRKCIDLKGSCPLCFTHKRNFKELLIHMKAEHKETCKYGKFFCNSCDFRTRSYDAFRRHSLQSHDCICNYCNKSLDSIEMLNRHIAGHSRNVKKVAVKE